MIGSSILSIMDRLAFEVCPKTSIKSQGNIGDSVLCVTLALIYFALPSHFLYALDPTPAFFIMVLNVSGSERHIRTIDSSHQEEFPMMSIEIPLELVLEFATMNNGSSVRAVSFLYYGVENLFPSGYPGEENR